MNKILTAVLLAFTYTTNLAYGRTSTLDRSARLRELDRRLHRNNSSISIYSNIQSDKDSYTIGCMREINGKRCGSKRVEGSPYCYNCKQIIDREIESKREESERKYNDALQKINASRQEREQERKRKKDEIANLKSSKWDVYFETLQERHKRFMTKQKAPQFPLDGFAE